MNHIILCEGFDEVFFLGYYLYKTSGWKYTKDGKVSELYDFPKVNYRKAKFSSVISITNPDRSTALFNTLFMSFPWEEKDEIIKHFRLLNVMLG